MSHGFFVQRSPPRVTVAQQYTPLFYNNIIIRHVTTAYIIISRTAAGGTYLNSHVPTAARGCIIMFPSQRRSFPVPFRSPNSSIKYCYLYESRARATETTFQEINFVPNVLTISARVRFTRYGSKYIYIYENGATQRKTPPGLFARICINYKYALGARTSILCAKFAEHSREARQRNPCLPTHKSCRAKDPRLKCVK